MKTRLYLYIIAFVAIMVSNPLFGQSQVRTTKLVYEAKNEYTLYRKPSMIDTSIVREWELDVDVGDVYQLMYVRYDIGKCNSSIGLFRIVQMNNNAPQSTGKEIPVDFYVTDIKTVGKVAYFCGSLLNGDWLFGKIRLNNNHDPVIQIYTGDEKWYHPQKIDVATYEGTAHVYSVGYYGYVQTSDIGDEYYAQSGLDNGKGPSITLIATSKGTFASELIVNNADDQIQPKIRFTRSTDGLSAPFLDGNETMSYEDVVVATNKVVFLGHFTDGSDADVALEHYPIIQSSDFSLISNDRRRFRINSYSSSGVRFRYYNTNNRCRPLSKVCGACCNNDINTTEDIIVFATRIGAICDRDASEKQLIGLDMIRIMNNDGSVERLGQTAIRRENSDLVDIKAHYRCSKVCKVELDNETKYETIWFSDVAVLIDVLGTDNKYHSEVITFHKLRQYYQYLDNYGMLQYEYQSLGKTYKVYIHNNNSPWQEVNYRNEPGREGVVIEGESINKPVGMLYDLKNYPRFTSLDVFYESDSSYLCASSVGVNESQSSFDVFQKKIDWADSTRCSRSNDCVQEYMIRYSSRHYYDTCYHLDLCQGHSGLVVNAGVSEPNYSPVRRRLENISRPKFVYKYDECAVEQVCIGEESSTGQGKGQRPRDAETSFEERVVISPNPSHELIRVTSNTELKRIEVFDINGVNVMNQDCGTKSAVIRLDKLTSGIYFMRIIDDTGVVTKAFSKE